MTWSDREWDWSEVSWGDTLCAARCMRPAQLLLDGLPYCIPCADRSIERLAAISILPRLRSELPPLGPHVDADGAT